MTVLVKEKNLKRGKEGKIKININKKLYADGCVFYPPCCVFPQHVVELRNMLRISATESAAVSLHDNSLLGLSNYIYYTIVMYVYTVKNTNVITHTFTYFTKSRIHGKNNNMKKNLDSYF